MTEAATLDATATPDPSQTPEGTPAGSPEDEGTDTAAQIASARKRQAGAEAARLVAVKQAKDLQIELDAIKATTRTGAEAEAVTVATLTEQLRVAKETIAGSEARTAAALLDVKYPNARTELPEVTDEVRLAKFEALLADDPEPVAPRRPNGPQNAANGAADADKPAETSADIEKRLRKMTLPWTQ